MIIKTVVEMLFLSHSSLVLAKYKSLSLSASIPIMCYIKSKFFLWHGSRKIYELDSKVWLLKHFLIEYWCNIGLICICSYKLSGLRFLKLIIFLLCFYDGVLISVLWCAGNFGDWNSCEVYESRRDSSGDYTSVSRIPEYITRTSSTKRMCAHTDISLLELFI